MKDTGFHKTRNQSETHLSLCFSDSSCLVAISQMNSRFRFPVLYSFRTLWYCSLKNDWTLEPTRSSNKYKYSLYTKILLRIKDTSLHTWKHLSINHSFLPKTYRFSHCLPLNINSIITGNILSKMKPNGIDREKCCVIRFSLYSQQTFPFNCGYRYMFFMAINSFYPQELFSILGNGLL